MSRPAIRNIHRRAKAGIPLRAFVRGILTMELPDPTDHPLAHTEATLMFDRAASWAINKGWSPLSSMVDRANARIAARS